ncbi:hypothetical protein ACQ4WX_35335 [Streptomyces lasalocidi]
MIVNAVTSFLGMLIEQVMKPTREFLADTLLATPDVTQHADIKRLWNWTLGTTAGIYVLFVTAGGITVMGYETVQTRYTLRQIAPRLLLGMAAAAASLTVMGKAIGLSNALAHAIMASDLSDAGQGMVERVLPFTLFGTPGLQLYLLILAIVTTALVLAVLIGFLVRVAVMALLAACAPLMLACHAHPLTDPVARLWWRGLARLPGHPDRAVDDVRPRAEAVLRPRRHHPGHPESRPTRHDARSAWPCSGCCSRFPAGRCRSSCTAPPHTNPTRPGCGCSGTWRCTGSSTTTCQACTHHVAAQAAEGAAGRALAAAVVAGAVVAVEVVGVGVVQAGGGAVPAEEEAVRGGAGAGRVEAVRLSLGPGVGAGQAVAAPCPLDGQRARPVPVAAPGQQGRPRSVPRPGRADAASAHCRFPPRPGLLSPRPYLAGRRSTAGPVWLPLSARREGPAL